MTERILVAGFGWSGSGAVIDFVREYEDVRGFRPDWEEGSLFKGRYSFAWLAREMQSRPVLIDEVREVVQALRGVPGVEDEFPKSQLPNLKRSQQIRYQFGGELVDSALAEFESWVGTRNRRRFMARTTRTPRPLTAGDLPAFQAACWRLVDRLMHASPTQAEAPHATYCLFNNDPPAYSVGTWRLLGPSKVVVVSRDLCDVYADLVRLGRHDGTVASAERFVREHRHKLDRFELSLFDADAGDRSPHVVIEFERFIKDETQRSGLASWIGLEYRTRGPFLFPEQSAQNIGIASALDEPVYELILREVELRRRELLGRSGPGVLDLSPKR